MVWMLHFLPASRAAVLPNTNSTLDFEINPTTTDCLSQFFNVSSSSTLSENTNLTSRLSFETLFCTGWLELRLLYPFTQLHLVQVLPVHTDVPGEMISSHYQDFLTMTIVGYDTKKDRWMRISNIEHTNAWGAVKILVDDPPASIAVLPFFLYPEVRITFADAFSRVRAAGHTQPFEKVFLEARVFPEVPKLGTAYVFVDPFSPNGYVVSASTGQVYKVYLPEDPPKITTA